MDAIRNSIYSVASIITPSLVDSFSLASESAGRSVSAPRTHATRITAPPIYVLIPKVSCNSHIPNRDAHTGSLEKVNAASVADAVCNATPSR